MPERITLKRRANDILAETKPNPAKITFVYLVIAAVMSALSNKLLDGYYTWVESTSNRFIQASIDGVEFVLTSPPNSKVMTIAVILSVALSVLMAVFEVGYLWYCLRITRREQMGYANLFDSFVSFGRTLCMFLLIELFVFLWSLLLVFPGIIAAYRYRQAYYLMLDHPEQGLLWCLRESKRLMRGRKMELFILDLSFLGWIILGGITLGIVLIWKLPYIETTYALFYQELVRISDEGNGGWYGGAQGDGGTQDENRYYGPGDSSDWRQ